MVGNARADQKAEVVVLANLGPLLILFALLRLVLEHDRRSRVVPARCGWNEEPLMSQRVVAAVLPEEDGVKRGSARGVAGRCELLVLGDGQRVPLFE